MSVGLLQDAALGQVEMGNQDHLQLPRTEVRKMQSQAPSSRHEQGSRYLLQQGRVSHSSDLWEAFGRVVIQGLQEGTALQSHPAWGWGGESGPGEEGGKEFWQVRPVC